MRRWSTGHLSNEKDRYRVTPTDHSSQRFENPSGKTLPVLRLSQMYLHVPFHTCSKKSTPARRCVLGAQSYCKESTMRKISAKFEALTQPSLSAPMRRVYGGGRNITRNKITS